MLRGGEARTRGLIAVGASAVIVLACVFLILAFSDAGSKPGRALAPDQVKRFREYTDAERELLRDHLARALSRLDGPRTEFAVAAAVNAYLHRYLVLKPVFGTGPDMLDAAAGICGGHAMAMADLLHLAGVDAREAVLLGIRWGGNHSMVVVRFSDGSTGLFDPTYGVFFAHRGRPVGIATLVRDPGLSARAFHADVEAKRTAAAAEVEPISSTSAGYSAGGPPVAVVAGEVAMDYRRAFATNRGWGVAFSERRIVTPIPVSAGETLGDPSGVESRSQPGIELAIEHAGSGIALPWAHMLGQQEIGYDVAHDLQLTRLRAGERYALDLFFAYARGSSRRVVARLPDGTSAGRALPVMPWTRRTSKLVRLRFTATSSDESVGLHGRGVLLMHAIRLREL